MCDKAQDLQYVSSDGPLVNMKGQNRRSFLLQYLQHVTVLKLMLSYQLNHRHENQHTAIFLFTVTDRAAVNLSNTLQTFLIQTTTELRETTWLQNTRSNAHT